MDAAAGRGVADDDANAMPTNDQALSVHRRPRSNDCEFFSSKRLPKLSHIRNMRVLGSDIAATKQVAE